MAFTLNNRKKIYATLDPDHYLWDFIPRDGDEFIGSFRMPIRVTKEEFEEAERRLTRYLKNTIPKGGKIIQEAIVGDNIYLPTHPNDAFLNKWKKWLTTRWSSSQMNIHIDSNVEFYDYSYNKILEVIKKASTKGIKTRTILNGRDMGGYALALALNVPTGLREITSDSSVFIDVKFISPIMSEEDIEKTANENTKIFQTYEKNAPKVAALLKGKEQMVSNHFHKKIMETIQKELHLNGGDISKVDRLTLIAKTPGLSIQDLQNSCRTYLSAQQCVEYNLFGKIR